MWLRASLLGYIRPLCAGWFGCLFVLVYLRCDSVSGPDGLVIGGGVGRDLGFGLACPVFLAQDIAGEGLLVRSGVV